VGSKESRRPFNSPQALVLSILINAVFPIPNSILSAQVYLSLTVASPRTKDRNRAVFAWHGRGVKGILNQQGFARKPALYGFSGVRWVSYVSR
jgi:hypothetical protein